VLAPRHALRARVVPRPAVSRASSAHATHEHDTREPNPKPDPDEPCPGDGSAALRIADLVPTAELTASGEAERVGPNVLSFQHWARLLDGKLYAQTARVDWALLLRRTFDVDVSRCARCDGPVRVRAVVTDSASVQKLLAALRRPRDPPLAVA
jgi:hypothetical protein